MDRVRKNEGLWTRDDRGTDGPHAVLTELPTLTCNHCNVVVIINPSRQRERGYCFKCHAYICDRCNAVAECRPLVQSIELALRYPGQIDVFSQEKPPEDIKLRESSRIWVPGQQVSTGGK